MHDYRRGVSDGTWQKLWHFVPACPSYPCRNFHIQRFKPDDDELCSRCWNLAREQKRVSIWPENRGVATVTVR